MTQAEIRKCSDDRLSMVIADHIFPGHHWRNQHRDFVNDASLSMMLLEKMAAWGGEPLLDFTVAGWSCMVFHRGDKPQLIELPACEKPGRAIAEAYAQSIQKEQV